MSRQNYLYLSQRGDPIWAHTVEELVEKAGGGHVSKMYVDRKVENADGTLGPNTQSMHVGYVVGLNWYTKFMPVEVPA